jgi:hypothetical protein
MSNRKSSKEHEQAACKKKKKKKSKHDVFLFDSRHISHEIKEADAMRSVAGNRRAQSLFQVCPRAVFIFPLGTHTALGVWDE